MYVAVLKYNDILNMVTLHSTAYHAKFMASTAVHFLQPADDGKGNSLALVFNLQLHAIVFN
jgi:hypothetical protein